MKNINLIIFLSILILLASCGTLPSGDNVLEDRFIEETSSKELNSFREEYVNKGRPIYIEAVTYPQILEGGHVYLGGTVGLFIGRENISLNNILEIKTNGLDSESLNGEINEIK